MTSPERPRAYTVDAAAAKAGVSRRTIFRLISLNELTAVRVKNRTLITEESLDRYIKFNADKPEYEIVETSEGEPCQSP
jgi:excisionase family DNA binding protein